MSLQFYVAINGTRQGQFKGESPRRPRPGKWIEVVAVDLGIQAPRDAASGQASGKRQHHPFKITKEFGTSTPLLMQACAKNETLSEVVIELVDLNAPGPKNVRKRITLANARITDCRPHVGPAAATGRVLSDFTFEYGGSQLFEYGANQGFEYGASRGFEYGGRQSGG